ncbi:unnamed protein product [Sphenostylis stenocarpa]|uniref:Uncharacterized protein n=1 Tax=Sphenostylis stenocarpa TaxID=92480 RepID=A0AA86VEL9_9FABA|nr:unnamed protein product [Sphenostylis stenocarpa]
MREWDVELLFPQRVLGVLQHLRVCHVAYDTETVTYGPLVMILLLWRVRWLPLWAKMSSEWNYSVTTMNIDDAIVIVVASDRHGKCER